MYDLAALESQLAGTAFAGKLHFTPLTDSTNTSALEAARAGAPHGSVFFADEQRAGRGRGDHAWHSAAGQGLYVSVLLRPTLKAERMPLLSLATGLAAAEAIQIAAGLKPDLRWPNDLLLGPRKTGGILIEGKTEAADAPSAGGPFEVAYVVAGIGINVHQREFPPNLATPATSLDLEAGRAVSRQPLLIALLYALQREVRHLERGHAASLLERLQQSSTWISGRAVEVHGPQACTGTTAGLDEHGFLRVQTASGLVTVQTGGLRAA
jgi:BirA family biotin operon repressor/biotin-[acetyl-CoA-carboxylase] ligase